MQLLTWVFFLKEFIPACMLSPSPSLSVSLPPSLSSRSLSAAAVNYETETFFVPVGCQTHTHINVPHGLESTWSSVSPCDMWKIKLHSHRLYRKKIVGLASGPKRVNPLWRGWLHFLGKRKEDCTEVQVSFSELSRKLAHHDIITCWHQCRTQENTSSPDCSVLEVTQEGFLLLLSWPEG